MLFISCWHQLCLSQHSLNLFVFFLLPFVYCSFLIVTKMTVWASHPIAFIMGSCLLDALWYIHRMVGLPFSHVGWLFTAFG